MTKKKKASDLLYGKRTQGPGPSPMTDITDRFFKTLKELSELENTNATAVLITSSEGKKSMAFEDDTHDFVLEISPVYARAGKLEGSITFPSTGDEFSFTQFHNFEIDGQSDDELEGFYIVEEAIFNIEQQLRAV